MTKIFNQFGEIDSANGGLAKAGQLIRDELDALKKHINEMLPEWDGKASAEYQQAQQLWDQSAGNLQSTLVAVSQAVGTGNNNMRETNEEVARAWRG